MEENGIIEEAQFATDTSSEGATEPIEASEAISEPSEVTPLRLEAFDAEASAFYESGLITSRERYSALRSMGLSAREAYLATGSGIDRESTKAHLISSVPSPARAPESAMSTQEMDAARSLFEGMSDADIRKLYNKVTR